MKSPHAKTELRLMYQALQVHKERNSGEGEAGWSSGERAIGHHYALCVWVNKVRLAYVIFQPTGTTEEEKDKVLSSVVFLSGNNAYNRKALTL